MSSSRGSGFIDNDRTRAAAGRLWRVAAIVALASIATGCGYHLRGQATYAFSSIYVNAPRAAPFQTQLTRALESGGNARVQSDAQGAQVILDVPGIVEEKDVLSLSSSGSVREYQLVMRVSFRLHDVDGLDWLPPAEIVLRRSYTFNETEVLARDAEEQRLLREMRSDAVAQLIRRLQAAHKPA